MTLRVPRWDYTRHTYVPLPEYLIVRLIIVLDLHTLRAESIARFRVDLPGRRSATSPGQHRRAAPQSLFRNRHDRRSASRDHDGAV